MRTTRTGLYKLKERLAQLLTSSGSRSTNRFLTSHFVFILNISKTDVECFLTPYRERNLKCDVCCDL